MSQYHPLSSACIVIALVLGALTLLTYAWLVGQDDPAALWGSLRGKSFTVPVWTMSAILAAAGFLYIVYFWGIRVAKTREEDEYDEEGAAQEFAVRHHQTWALAGLTLFLCASIAWAPLTYYAKPGRQRAWVGGGAVACAALGTLVMLGESVAIKVKKDLRARYGSLSTLLLLVAGVLLALHACVFDGVLWTAAQTSAQT